MSILFLLPLCIVATIFVAYLLTAYVLFNKRKKFAVEYSKKALVYSRVTTNKTITLLVVGDSTGTGIGAQPPEECVAGRLAQLMNATYVESVAHSGAQVSSLFEEFDKAMLPLYDVILIQIGANDIVRFHNVEKTTELLATFLELARAHGRRVFLMSVADVGTATLFPRFVRPFHSWFTQKYHRAFANAAAQRDVTYVNLYEPRASDPLYKDPAHYLAPDRFHPSGLGYGFWFEKLKKAYAVDAPPSN